jgi:hypothetical protein
MNENNMNIGETQLIPVGPTEVVEPQAENLTRTPPVVRTAEPSSDASMLHDSILDTLDRADNAMVEPTWNPPDTHDKNRIDTRSKKPSSHMAKSEDIGRNRKTDGHITTVIGNVFYGTQFSWEANNHTVKTFPFFMEPEGSLSSLFSIMSQMNAVHSFPPYFLQLHFDIILPPAFCLPSRL